MTLPHDALPEAERAQALVSLLERRGDEVLQLWVRLQTADSTLATGGSDRAELERESVEFLDAVRDAVSRSRRIDDPSGPAFEPLRRMITELSRRGVRNGLRPADTARGVLALREALFGVLQTEHADESIALNVAAVSSARLVDALALLTFESFVQSREDVISRQSDQLMELSTPVVQLWDGIVGVPLVGTLDSARAQVVMETLLQTIVDQQALVAILDITGVPTVDTLVAQHLLKTVTATRLMGADCIISGIRPQTAQTIVQLGIDLTDITTRATLADALATGIRRAAEIRGTVPAGTTGA